jgi:hypothetical protein
MKLIYICAYASFLAVVSSVCDKRSDGTWAIGLMFGASPFSLFAPSKKHSAAPCVRNPILTCADITDVNASYVADPFLYIDDAKNVWHLFFEVMNFNRGRGEIGTAFSTNKVFTSVFFASFLKIHFRASLGPTLAWCFASPGTWPIHLSSNSTIRCTFGSSLWILYPLILFALTRRYMIPDKMGKLALYTTTDFPGGWKLQRHLLEHRLVDASVVKYNGSWWMFGIFDDYGMFYHHVYFSDSPIGPWNPTPNNCFSELKCEGQVKTPHKSGHVRKLIGVRNGGTPVVYNDKLYRVVQRTKHAYGDGLDFYQVTKLSKTGIFEEVLDRRFRHNFRSPGNVQKWNIARFHHLDLHRLNNPKGLPLYVGVIDGDKEGRDISGMNLTIVGNTC